MNSINKTNKFSQGFTLIELLVVIGILGVLATVLLVAINPLEQLARTRDAGRTSMVTQLGRAFAQYASTQGGTGFLPDAGANMKTLVQANEINGYLQAPTSSNNISQACNPAAGTGVQLTLLNGTTPSGFCYHAVTGPNDAFIWAPAESQAYQTKCNTTTQYAYIVYVESKGKAGVDCFTTNGTQVPTAGDTLN